MSWLRELVWAGAEKRYPGMPDHVRERLERELDVIEQKDFPGYFLIVYDIVREARSRGILCQGRGSAANSAVCYVLDITAVDSIFFDLPFERFLSALRDEEPDIDVDFDSDRREEIIQYVYAQVRPAQRRAGRERHQLPAEGRGARHGEGARLLHRAAGRLVEAGRALGRGGLDRRPRHPRPGRRARRAAAHLPAAPRHPLGRHGAHRPARRRGVPHRARPHGEPHRAAVGQGRLRVDGPREVRPARARHARRAAVHLRPRARARPARSGSSRPSRRRRRPSTTCSAAPTRSGCSRSRAAPRWARSPG